MKADSSTHHSQARDRHILIAVDESENSERAVLYTADLLGGQAGCRLTLLSIVSEPAEDYFSSIEERAEWVANRRARIIKLLEDYHSILLRSGFREDKVAFMIEVRYCPSIADCILDVQKKLGASTLVIGRRGLSKKEEFLFGSTSNSILHAEKDCALWVIE